MAASRTCSSRVLLLGGLLVVVVNFAVTIGLTLNMGLTRQEITTSLGQPANLGCYVNQANTTSLTYSWTKDNSTVTQSSNLRVYDNVLVVTPKNNTDFGVYECHVSDGVTSTKCNISLLPGCSKTEPEGIIQAHLGCANISVLMPVLAFAVVSLLLNIHFFVRWKRRDRWVFSEEDIMQLHLAQESIPVEEITDERVDIKQKKPFFGRLRKRRREDHETDQHMEENDRNHQEIVCESDTRGKRREEAIEMQEIQDIPSVAEIKAANKDNDERAPTRSDEIRRPGVSETPSVSHFFKSIHEENEETAPAVIEAVRSPKVSETPRIADFFNTTDEEKDGTAPAVSEAARSPKVSETPRIADFFNTADEENDTTVPALSEAVRSPKVSETPRIADFFNIADQENDTSAPTLSESIRSPAVSETPRIADFFNTTVEDDETAPALSETVRRPDVSETPRIADFFNTTVEDDETAPAPSETVRRPDVSETPRIADFFNTTVEDDETAPALSETVRRPDVSETPRIADFFNTTVEDDESEPAISEAARRPGVSETPRIADFFLPSDDSDGEGSRRDSMNSEEPLVSHYMEKMDFEGKGESDDEPVLK
ncbi:hypothetical protein ACROYT_G044143 [Oculina patagonica]